MSRRSTPERLDEARAAATRNRLIGERLTPGTRMDVVCDVPVLMILNVVVAVVGTWFVSSRN